MVLRNIFLYWKEQMKIVTYSKYPMIMGFKYRMSDIIFKGDIVIIIVWP